MNDKDANVKRFLGFVAMSFYIVIGFTEALSKVRFDIDFKSNMMYLGAVGLFYFFSKEIVQLVNLIRKKQ